MLVKSLSRTLGNGLAVVLGLWGAVVTPGFEWAFGALVIVGAINLFATIWDERKRGRRQSEQKAEIAGLQESVSRLLERVIPPTEVPYHLQNLRNLSVAELRGAIDALNGRLRIFESQRHSEMGSRFMARPPDEGQMQPIERQKLYEQRQALGQQSMQNHLDVQDRLRPEAIALYEEVLRRIPASRPTREPVLIAYGMAGVAPLNDFANVMERLARELPGD